MLQKTFTSILTLFFSILELVEKKKRKKGNSLAVQWLGLSILTVGAPGLIPGPGIKIPQATQHSQKKKRVG